MQLFSPAIVPRKKIGKNTPLPAYFQPSELDVICSRGKNSFNHEGNKRYQAVIEDAAESYIKVEKRVDKSLVVISIMDKIRRLSPDGGFVRFCKEQKCYVEIGDSQVREKIGHDLRLCSRRRKERHAAYCRQNPVSIDDSSYQYGKTKNIFSSSHSPISNSIFSETTSSDSFVEEKASIEFQKEICRHSRNSDANYTCMTLNSTQKSNFRTNKNPFILQPSHHGRAPLLSPSKFLAPTSPITPLDQLLQQLFPEDLFKEEKFEN